MDFDQKQHASESMTCSANDAILEDLRRIARIATGDGYLSFGDPPSILDNVYEDDEDSSCEMVSPVLTCREHSQYSPEDLKKCSKGPSEFQDSAAGTTSYTSTQRGTGPVDLDDSIVSSIQTNPLRLGPVDLDETIIEDDDTNTDGANRLPKPVDLDSVQDREDNFSMILKEHEDEFLVWQGNEKLQKLFLKNAFDRQRYGHSCRSNTKFQQILVNDKFVNIDDGNTWFANPNVARVEECKHNNDMASMSSCNSLDTYGFSLTDISVDTYGFSLKGSSSRSGPSSSAGDSSSVGSTEESRGRTIRRIKDVLNKDKAVFGSDDSSAAEGLGAKARGLRALRLRSAKYNKARLVEPKFSTVHEHEVLSHTKAEGGRSVPVTPLSEKEKQTNFVVDNPNSYDLVVQKQKQSEVPDATAQSVVSDITNLSDKLFLQVKTDAATIWDDFSSLGLNGVELKRDLWVLQASNDPWMGMNEVPGHNEEPPVYFDASIKTPPLLFKAHIVDEEVGIHSLGPESNWDDVSSIGLLSVEALRKGQKFDSAPGEVHIPVVVTSSGVYYVSNCNKNVVRVNSRRRDLTSPSSRQSQDIFRTKMQGYKQNTGYKLLELSPNPTFSTVGTGDSGTSSVTCDKDDCPEMHGQREVSSTSISEVSKDVSVIQRHSLTPRDWIIIAVISLMIVTASTLVVFYVYANV